MAESKRKKERHNALWIAPVVAIVLIFWIGSVYAAKTLDAESTLAEAAEAVNSLFAALAFAGVIATLVIQMRELAYQRDELEMTREELAKTAVANTLSARINALIRLVDLPPLSDTEKEELADHDNFIETATADATDANERELQRHLIRKYFRNSGDLFNTRLNYLTALSRLERRLMHLDRHADLDFEHELLAQMQKEEQLGKDILDVLTGKTDPKESKVGALAQFVRRVAAALKESENDPAENPDR